jgi:gentisate 1,2-dioxygenase
VRYVNPLTGGPSMPLLDSSLLQVDPDRETSPVRTNSHAVALVVAGSGDTTFGDQRITWCQRDIFTVPPGHWVSHRAGPDGARLFVVSDRDALDRLGLLREELGNRAG